MTINLVVYINSVHGSQMAAKINGKFTLNGIVFRFNAIAFGRIGGHNIGVKISKLTESRLKNIGYDINEIITKLQRDLLEGNITVPPKLKLESFAD